MLRGILPLAPTAGRAVPARGRRPGSGRRPALSNSRASGRIMGCPGMNCRHDWQRLPSSPRPRSTSRRAGLRGRGCGDLDDPQPLVHRERGLLPADERQPRIEPRVGRRHRRKCAGFCAARRGDRGFPRGIRGFFESCAAHCFRASASFDNWRDSQGTRAHTRGCRRFGHFVQHGPCDQGAGGTIAAFLRVVKNPHGPCPRPFWHHTFAIRRAAVADPILVPPPHGR